MRLLFISDFTEQFPYRLLRGILDYSRRTGQVWEVCKMPPSFKKEIGLKKFVAWAKRWRADAVIGQFSPKDDVSLFRKNGIVAIAQDYVSPFSSIPNITADYGLTGSMAAERFFGHGFKNFGFFGYSGVCWSDGRLEGFRRRLEAEGLGERLHVYDRQQINSLWNYDRPELLQWLLTLPKPIGIFACDDNQAEILVEACHVAGINVPMDVAIIGVDNDEVTCNLSSPAITSIEMDIEKAGYEAAEMAARMVEDANYKGEDVVIKPVSVVGRASTGIVATKDEVVATAIRYIYDNRSRKILVSDVLRQVPVSRRLLEQRFKDVVGTTIYNMMSVLRMEYFAHQLITTNDTISEIAARMDEPDTKSISRRFRELKGCTPTEYRNRELRKLGV